MDHLNNKIFRIVSSAAKEQGVRAFVIGGYVRDCFLGRPCKDIDIVVEGSGCKKGRKQTLSIQEFRYRNAEISGRKEF